VLEQQTDEQINSQVRCARHGEQSVPAEVAIEIASFSADEWVRRVAAMPRSHALSGPHRHPTKAMKEEVS
jgi:hypothetical protein